MEEFITILGLILGILGLAGTILTAITFVNPKVRVDFYLNKHDKWEEVHLNLGGGGSLWRYQPHPEFTIEQQDDSEKWGFDVTESWMKYPLPDPSKHTYMVHVKASGIVIYAEKFITLDGGRYFVPLPRVKYHEEKENNEYFYVPLQIKIARIIGTYYRMDSIDEFIKHNEIEIRKNI